MNDSSRHEASRRMMAVQSPIIPKVAEWIRATPETLSMAQGVVNYGPTQTVLKQLSITSEDTGLHHYGPVQGSLALREAILEKLEHENNISVENLDCLTITAGANMGFLNALFAITEPGDEIILLAPYYFNHEMAITMLNCTARVVPTDSSYQPDIESIVAAINSKTRALVTISPNNPTGAVYSKEVLQTLNQLCAEKGIYHISDEAYEYFHYAGSTHYSPAASQTSQNHTISLFSLSKSYGVAGWRIGYMVAPEHLAEAISKAQDTNLICANRLAQRLGRLLLQQGRKHCLQESRYLEQNRTICLQALDSLGKKLKYVAPDGAFYLFLAMDTDIRAEQLVHTLIQDYQVAVLPGETFGFHDDCGLRLSFGALSPEQCDIAMERLVTGLSRTIGRS